VNLRTPVPVCIHVTVLAFKNAVTVIFSFVYHSDVLLKNVSEVEIFLRLPKAKNLPILNITMIIKKVIIKIKKNFFFF